MKQATPKVYKVTNFASIPLDGPDAPLVEHLVKDAEARVDKIKDLVREEIMPQVRNLLCHAETRDDELAMASAQIAAAALSTAEVAGAARMAATGEIARGLRVLIEDGQAKRAFHTGAIRLHLDALVLVSRTGEDSAEAKVVADQLQAMLRHMGLAD
jgi:hypothetical protein